jgi:hypothetical protein
MASNHVQSINSIEEPRPLVAGQPLNILVLSPYFPYPPAHGGAVRIFNLIKQLSQKNHVTLLSFIDSEAERSEVPQMLRYCQEVHVFARRPDMRRLSPFGLTPMGVAEFADADFQRKVKYSLNLKILSAGCELIIKYIQHEKYKVYSCKYAYI